MPALSVWEFNGVLFVEEFCKLQTLCEHHHYDHYTEFPAYILQESTADN